jgi:hypothetical protein
MTRRNRRLSGVSRDYNLGLYSKPPYPGKFESASATAVTLTSEGLWTGIWPLPHSPPWHLKICIRKRDAIVAGLFDRAKRSEIIKKFLVRVALPANPQPGVYQFSNSE